jgi:hypothetical protein
MKETFASAAGLGAPFKGLHIHHVSVSRILQNRFTILWLMGTVIVWFMMLRASLGLRSAPPTWKDMREYERDLPQHNPNLTFPEGRDGRYVRFPSQNRGFGWNNVLPVLYVVSPQLKCRGIYYFSTQTP